MIAIVTVPCWATVSLCSPFGSRITGRKATRRRNYEYLVSHVPSVDEHRFPILYGPIGGPYGYKAQRHGTLPDSGNRIHHFMVMTLP